MGIGTADMLMCGWWSDAPPVKLGVHGSGVHGSAACSGAPTSAADVEKVFEGGDVEGVIISLGGKTKDVGPTMLTDGTTLRP